MLVLTRKTNQSIMIGDDVEVTVLAVSRDKIRLGITAPRDIPVFRKEVYISIQEEGANGDCRARRRSGRRGPGRARQARVDAAARAAFVSRCLYGICPADRLESSSALGAFKRVLQDD